ncbi:Tryptophan synthase beta chain 2 [Rhynchospora pubera]|uniref:Tryptophan synthase beta chain 2 n=1 Tax=Rhynchospora pubera TaxID=906938 RepID=A0AAV8CM65_9POAL|nr:Tryptophan synthase beta chain 2 [Rhynchospora pubera]
MRTSYDQKPYCRLMMETRGAKIHPLPSIVTVSGREILESNPSYPGSLGIVISEAVEIAAINSNTKYYLSSVLNHVLLHQTVIGEEFIKQLEALNKKPDLITGCTGCWSNFSGLMFTFIREKIEGRMNPVFQAVEPAACSSLTKGVLGYMLMILGIQLG